jgi:uncharacterized repeat protein (TIGR01451 family)
MRKLIMSVAAIAAVIAPAAAMADTTTPSADVAITETANRSLIPWGVAEPVTYVITVTNTGLSDAQNVVMQDWAMCYQSVSTTGSTAPVHCTTPVSNGMGTVSFTTPLRKVGDTMKITLNAKVFLFPNQCVTSNRSSVTSATPDPNLSNNTAAVGFRASNFWCH